MTSLFLLYIIHHIALAIGLACSLVADIFIIVVEKTKRIRGIEKKILNRVLSYSVISSLCIFLLQMMYLLFTVVYGPLLDIRNTMQVFAVITTILSACIVFLTTSQKYYQIKILYRYQEKHEHLSNTFIEHHKELRYTALLSVILWITLYMCYVIL